MSLHQLSSRPENDLAGQRHVSDLFNPPMGAWTPDQILNYFQARNSIAYFPVVDEGESAKEKMDGILEDLFELNHERHHHSIPADWFQNPSSDREWLFMLHKFYYAVGLGKVFQETGDLRYAEKWVALTSSWMDSVPLDFLPSRVAGRRIQNWIYAHYFFVSSTDSELLQPDFYVKFLGSLQAQVKYLCAHLDTARNHRTLELAAIFLAAVVFPEFKEAQGWLEFSRKALDENLEKDLLPDGVHCELSTEYHHLVLKNYLGVMRLAKLNDIGMPQSMHHRIQQALEFAMYVHKPDGLIPAISDGDVGSYLSLLQQGYDLYGCPALQYVATKGMKGRPPANRSKGFSESGYYILRSGWGTHSEPFEEEKYLLFDCGPLGAGNHGHFDLLSFEMAAYGQSLIVDPGRYTYDESGEINWRERFRGTAYHNTVMVDGKHQTRYLQGKTKLEIKGPEPGHEIKAFISQPGFDYVHGVATSFEYPVIHERKIFSLVPEYWIIVDTLRAQEEHHQYDLLFHLSPSALHQVSVRVACQTLTIGSPHLILCQPFDPAVHPFVEEGFISDSYGRKKPAPIVRFRSQGTSTNFYTVIYPYRDVRPRISVEHLPVYAGKPRSSFLQASVLRVSIEKGSQYVQDHFFVNHDPGLGSFSFGDQTYAGRFCFTRNRGDGPVTLRHQA